MSTEAIITALQAKRSGNVWMARCPAHHDRTPSLSIRRSVSGKTLVHCFGGCTQKDVIAALERAGLWSGCGARHEASISTPCREEAEVDHRPHRDAMAIWSTTHPAFGTLAESYIRARGLTIPPPGTLRFHPSLKHPSNTLWPAMVALVTRGCSGEPVAIHRTFLTPDGSGKAPVDPQKMMLGPCRGGAVRLAPPGDLLMVGEGIETCLSAMQATGKPAWAALSTSGLGTLDLPDTVREVVILADSDDAGEAAAKRCAAQWRREGRKVRIARPPRGMDFNDLLNHPRQSDEAA